MIKRYSPKKVNALGESLSTKINEVVDVVNELTKESAPKPDTLKGTMSGPYPLTKNKSTCAVCGGSGPITPLVGAVKESDRLPCWKCHRLDHDQPKGDTCPECGGDSIVREGPPWFDDKACPTCNGTGKKPIKVLSEAELYNIVNRPKDPDTITIKPCCWVCKLIPRKGLGYYCHIGGEEAITTHSCEHFQLKKELAE